MPTINENHLRPLEAGAGTELANKNIFFFHEVASKFIRFGLVYNLNHSPFLKGWITTFLISLRLYAFC